MKLLGIDVGGTNIKLAVVTDAGFAEKAQVPTQSEDGGPEAVLARIADLGRAHGPADAIGVALPGLFDDDGRALLLPNLSGDWLGRPIREPLSEALGVGVSLVNDGHAFALAEARLGAGSGAQNVMCVVCGTGVGGGLILDGRLHLGTAQRAGAFGHQTVFADGPACACGNRGCLELYAGARAIASAAEQASFDDAVEAARSGDAQAIAALARAGSLIGRAIANVLIFLCPERVVVGGGVAAAGDALFDPLRDAVRKHARVAPLELIEIREAVLGSFAGAVGAALLASDAAGLRSERAAS